MGKGIQRSFRNSHNTIVNYLQDTMKEKAKECLLDYIQARSDQFFLRKAVQNYCKKVAISYKCLVKGYKKRQIIKEKLGNSVGQIK